MNILIVEDDAFYLDMIVTMVRGWTHDVTCAESGRAALEKAAAMDFDLLLLDVFLPDMTAIGANPQAAPFSAGRPDHYPYRPEHPGTRA